VKENVDMIDAEEHLYDDDPGQGHPDVRTQLKDVEYFFLGNGYVKAAVQLAPSGEGTPVALLLMPPEVLAKKRDSLLLDPETGLESTMIQLKWGETLCTPHENKPSGKWSEKAGIPTVVIEWSSGPFLVCEVFFCPDMTRPAVAREITIRNASEKAQEASCITGTVGLEIVKSLVWSPGQEHRLIFSYQLLEEESQPRIELVPAAEAAADAKEFWSRSTRLEFSSDLLNRFYRSCRNQLPAVISTGARVDASIWQYNREWVRDHVWMAMGLLLAGWHDLARRLLDRLIRDFVTPEGDTIDSSERRHPNEVELDQNGELLYALDQYFCWTGDESLIRIHWKKIIALAEFPLLDIFRHEPSGLLVNSREYWERHGIHGIEKGMESAYQFFVSLGLSSAAKLARRVGRDGQAARWDAEANRIKRAVLNDSRYGMIEHNRILKRRNADGIVPKTIEASAAAGLPPDGPLGSPGPHWIEPDTSTVLPIAFEFIPPESPLASETLKAMDLLWDQDWTGGGYGRYHASSEPDSSGSWPFPSLFVARAACENRSYQRVWDVLNWLDSMPGAVSGSWFEFYGHPHCPPFAQTGITPWTWGEILMLFIHHILGVRPQHDRIRIRPRLLSGLSCASAELRIKNTRLRLNIKRDPTVSHPVFRTNGRIISQLREEIVIGGDQADLEVDIRLSEA
jgi:hypothetical protein